MHRRSSHTRRAPRYYGSTIGSHASSPPAVQSTLHGEGDTRPGAYWAMGEVFSLETTPCAVMCISILRVPHIRTKKQCVMHTIVRLRVLSWMRCSVRMIWLRRRHPRTVMPSTSYQRWIRRSSTLRSTPTDLPNSAAPPPVRSPTTSTARRSATPARAGGHPLAVPHIPALPLPGFADPLSPGPRRSLTTPPPLRRLSPAGRGFVFLGHRG